MNSLLKRNRNVAKGEKNRWWSNKHGHAAVCANVHCFMREARLLTSKLVLHAAYWLSTDCDRVPIATNNINGTVYTPACVATEKSRHVAIRTQQLSLYAQRTKDPVTEYTDIALRLRCSRYAVGLQPSQR